MRRSPPRIERRFSAAGDECNLGLVSASHAVPSDLRSEVRKFDWSAFEPRAALVCLPAIAISLIAGVATGHPGAAMVAAGGAQTAGFGAFQKPVLFRGGAMLVATTGMALSATVGCLLGRHTAALVAASVIWAFVYGMAGAISSPEQWVGQQCCTFLVVSSAFPSDFEEAAMRGLGVLAGGLLQTVLVKFLWRFTAPPASAMANPETHPHGWRWCRVRENLTIHSTVFRFAVRLACIAVVSVIVYHYSEFPNAYWIPMTALILPKPDRFATLQRGVSRVIGTVIGAGLASLLATLVGPRVSILILLVVLFMWAAYALQNVNYAAYIVVLTGYIAFDLAIGKQPEAVTAWHRVLATTIGGAIAILAYLIHMGLVRTVFRRTGWASFAGRGLSC